MSLCASPLATTSGPYRPQEELAILTPQASNGVTSSTDGDLGIDGKSRGIQGITLKLALDSNGAVADTSANVSERFTCEASLDMVHRLRRDCDAVLVGRATVEMDDCTLTVRRVPTTRSQPTRIVIDPNLLLDLKRYKIATDGLPTIIVHALKSGQGYEATEERYSKRIHEEFPNVTLLGVPALTVEKSRLTISAKTLTRILSQDFGMRHIMVEGGPSTALTFLQERMVDRAIVVEAPVTFSKGLPSNITPTTLVGAGLKELSSYMLDVDNVTSYSRPDLPWPASNFGTPGPAPSVWP